MINSLVESIKIELYRYSSTQDLLRWNDFPFSNFQVHVFSLLIKLNIPMMNDTEFKLNRNCSNFAVKPGAEKEKCLSIIAKTGPQFLRFMR